MSILHLIGQIIFGAYFVISGINHFTHHKDLTQYASSLKVPSPAFAVYFSGILLLLGGLGVLLNVYVNISLWLLVAFLLPVSLKMHAFWNDSDPQTKMSNQTHFMKNIALLGAVLWMMF